MHWRSAGFTLLEVVVVTAILAILATLMVPMLTSNPGREVNDAAERFLTLLNQAREEAVLSARVWRVDIDSERDVYRFLERSDGEFVPTDLGVLAGSHETGVVDLSGLSLNGDDGLAVAECLVLPSGEQDSLELTFVAGEVRRTVSLPPIGDAALVSP